VFEKEPIMTSRKNISETDLDHLVYEIYWFIDFFNTVFFNPIPVSVPILSFEVNRRKSLGHYPVEGKAHAGGKDINIYKINPHQNLREILTTLVHLMVHSWQDHHGQSCKGWFHNKEFRAKMAEIGILCNKNGHHTDLGDPFVFLLKKHGVSLGSNSIVNGLIKISPKQNPKGKSKLKLWRCGCRKPINVRVAVKNFEAICLQCENKFELIL
jgi:hypothetical protein